MSQSTHVRSPRPHCPDPDCGKVWAPTRRDIIQIRAEIIAERNAPQEPVRYYEHAGGWHWTRMQSKPNV